jgi:hypothetical protein
MIPKNYKSFIIVETKLSKIDFIRTILENYKYVNLINKEIDIGLFSINLKDMIANYLNFDEIDLVSNTIKIEKKDDKIFIFILDTVKYENVIKAFEPVLKRFILENKIRKAHMRNHPDKNFKEWYFFKKGEINEN